jgi:hypothetical protein
MPYHAVLQMPYHAVLQMPYHAVLQMPYHAVLQMPYHAVLQMPYHAVLQMPCALESLQAEPIAGHTAAITWKDIRWLCEVLVMLFQCYTAESTLTVQCCSADTTLCCVNKLMQCPVKLERTIS